MNTKTLIYSAPSNIALIKYMGKKNSNLNVPMNSSLSYTLPHLRSYVRLQPSESDQWKPLQQKGILTFHMSSEGQNKYLTFFKQLKESLGLKGNFCVESGNNFPSDAGIASSASSFAALTLACFGQANLLGEDITTPEQIQSLDLLKKCSQWSQKGSGSSCRSFFSPWSLWTETGAQPIDLPYKDLLHMVVLVDQGKKAISSRKAHQRVSTSLLMEGRSDRANRRLSALIEEMKNQRWEECQSLIWAEFWDMHALFETSTPPFGYMTEGSHWVLKQLKDFRMEHQTTGPWVTMDAGPNVHLLFQGDDLEMAKLAFSKIRTHFQVLWPPLFGTHREDE